MRTCRDNSGAMFCRSTLPMEPNCAPEPICRNVPASRKVLLSWDILLDMRPPLCARHAPCSLSDP